VCSFCGKSARRVAHLVRGPGVDICNECVTVAVEEIEKLESERGRSNDDSLLPGPPLCSFCGKSAGRVAHLVRGPGVDICNECVTVAVEEIEKLESERGRSNS
jgi:ATP-dependent protease Clp ATPase subunit